METTEIRKDLDKLTDSHAKGETLRSISNVWGRFQKGKKRKISKVVLRKWTEKCVRW